MMVCEIIVGVRFHAHSLIIDALYRLGEMRSSNISFLYFSFYEKRFNENQICWAARNYLIIGLVQFFSMVVIAGFAFKSLVLEKDLKAIKEIPTLPIIIVISMCILFTMANMYLYCYSDELRVPE